jgi:hypothetical protein
MSFILFVRMPWSDPGAMVSVSLVGYNIGHPAIPGGVFRLKAKIIVGFLRRDADNDDINDHECPV